MLLDIRTLLVAVILAAAFCAGARILLWRLNLNIPGLDRWALAGGSAVITFLFILLYGIFNWSVFLSLTQTFTVITLLLSWDGFRRFIDKPPLTPFILYGIAAVAFVWVVIAQAQHYLQAKAVANAIAVAVLSLLIARDLIFSSKHNAAAIRVTGYIYAINAAVFLIRSFITQDSFVIVGPLKQSGIAAFMLLWLLCLIIAVTLGMVLMTTERLQADLDNQANHDPLTGALNRRSFSLLYEKAMAHSSRHQLPLSVLMMDLDEFKKVNDLLGHNFGDTVLCQFVAVANKILREDDVFCRFGGEEFIALLPSTSSAEALIVANRLRDCFAIDAALIETKEATYPFAITTSIGIAELKQDESFETLLRRADAALYCAKGNGRNCCELAL